MAARLIYGRGRFERVSDLIRDRLHWLRVPQRISFKCALLAYKAQHSLAPHYIKNYCQPTSSLQCRYELRSLTGVSLIIPRTKTKFGERSFAVAGPKSWNSLHNHVKAASSIGTFKSRLKTFLFGLSCSDQHCQSSLVFETFRAIVTGFSLHSYTALYKLPCQ